VHIRRKRERGFSLSEVLTVVAMIGVITLVTVPAMVQLLPQYRIRSAASDAGASLRMIRQKAITTRTPWKVSFDPARERYSFYKLQTPTSARDVVGNWDMMSRDLRKKVSEGQWIRVSAIDLRTNTTNPFLNVDSDSDSTVDIIFLRDGTVANDGGLTFATLPSVVFAVDNRFVKYNRYYLTLSQNGTLAIRATKE